MADDTTTGRDPAGRFKPGHSGNPRGPAKLDVATREEIDIVKGPLTLKAIRTLERNMDSDDGTVSNAAARIWLNKTVPDAAIAIELTGKDGGPLEFDYSKLSKEQLDVLIALLEQAKVTPDDGNATS